MTPGVCHGRRGDVGTACLTTCSTSSIRMQGCEAASERYNYKRYIYGVAATAQSKRVIEIEPRGARRGGDSF